MPLIKNLHQRRDRDIAMDSCLHDASLPLQHSQDTDYEDFELDDEDLDSDIEGSVIHRAISKNVVSVPTIPAKNQRRASKMDLQSVDGSKGQEIDTKSMVQDDPLELYLSSEEEDSFSDEEYTDSLLDFEPLEDGELDTEERAQSSGASSRKSPEVTARAVSFTLVKPQIVDILHSTSLPSRTPPRLSSSAFETDSSRRSSIFEAHPTSRSGSPSRRPTPRRPSPIKLYPSSIRRMSISSLTQFSHTSSSTSTPSVQTNSSQRKSSRMANLASLVTSSLQHNSTHAFLRSDPFPSEAAFHDSNPSQTEVQTPTTPTRMAADAFKRGLTRGLHRARKPSMQKLNAALSSRNSSMLNLSQPQESESTEQSPVTQRRRKSLALPRNGVEEPPSIPEEGLLRHQDIVKSATKPSPVENASPAKARTSIFGGLSRRKSVRIV